MNQDYTNHIEEIIKQVELEYIEEGLYSKVVEKIFNIIKLDWR
jgi:hypothetical protein